MCYIFIVLKIILTLYKYNSIYFIVYIILNILLWSLRKLASIDYFRDDQYLPVW